MDNPDDIEPIVPDRETIIQAMFDAEGYMTAAEVEEARTAAQEAAEHPLPSFSDRIV